MRLPSPLPAVAGAALALAASSLAAQPAAFVEEIDVSLVDVEVVVTDRQGKPVTGLMRDDFELRYDGKRVAITHFAAIEGGRPLPPAADGAGDAVPAPLASARAGRLNLVIYLDRTYLEPGEIEAVVAALRGFLRRGLRPGDRVMLVTANRSLTIVQPLTSLPELALAQLDELPPSAPRSRAAGDFFALLAAIERQVQGGPDVLARERNSAPQTLKSQIDGFAVETHRELEQTTHQLHRLIPALAGLPGRTAILYVGGTLPADAGQALYKAWRSAFGPGSRYQISRGAGRQDDSQSAFITLGGPVNEIDAGALFEAVAARANDFGITLHAVDAGGLRGQGFLASRGHESTRQGGGDALIGAAFGASQRVGNPQILAMMAETTGGVAIKGSRDFHNALDSLAAQLRSYYTLGFPPPSEARAERHRLEVRLKRRHKGLEVRHRRSFRLRDADHQAADRAVTALVLGETDNPLSVELAAAAARPIAGRDDVVRLPLSILVPVASLTFVPDGESGYRAQMSVYLTSGGLAQGATQVQKAVVPVAFAAGELEGALLRTIEYALELPVPAGSAAVAAAVRDDYRPLTATVVLPLAPPQAGDR